MTGRGPRGARTRRSAALVAAGAAVLLAGCAAGVSGGGGAPALLPSRDVPPVPADASPTPLGTPPPAPAGEGGWRALQSTTAPGGVRPVAFDPCRPLRYVVRGTAAAPAGGDLAVRQALERLSEVTGLVLLDDGETDEAPSDDRAPLQPDRYGDRWAPVLVAWSDPAESPGLAGDVLAYAGPLVAAPSGTGSERYVSGLLVLDGPQLGEVQAQQAGQAAVRGVLLHELGHLVGLDHVEDSTSLMHPSLTPLTVDFSAADLRGLAHLGSGPCFDDA